MEEKKCHIHFIGIGGVGMSGIAFVLIDLGYKISGSDLKSTKITDKLKERGVVFYQGHHEDNVNDADLVVISSAIPEKNPEIQASKKKGLKVLKRAEMLARIMKHKFGIAISGTHGKTTTTSMIGFLLEQNGFDPTVIIGGEGNNFKGNAKSGLGDYVVAEADESDGTFLDLLPKIAVVTNIEDDHLDYYKNMDNILSDFERFISKIDHGGKIILCADCQNVQKLQKKYKNNSITYGITNPADFQAKEIYFDKLNSNCKIYFKDEEVGILSLNISGYHNILNALAAIAVGHELEIKFEKIVNALNKFTGVKRRMEVISDNKDNIMILDDYAHHPTEVMATLNALKKSWKNRRIIAVFQPHRFTRTKLLAKKFGTAFFDADQVIVNDIYSANELPIEGISGETIFNEIKKSEHDYVEYIPIKENILTHLEKIVHPGDIVITLGAGDIWTIGRELSQKL